MTTISELADRLVTRQAASDPVSATFEGIATDETKLTDYSPAGHAERADICRDFIERLNKTESLSRRDEIARGTIIERLRLDIEHYDSGDYLDDMSFSWSPMQAVRSMLDQMSSATKEDRKLINARIENIPAALSGYIETLRLGISRGRVASKRQTEACILQARTWSDTSPAFEDFANFLQNDYLPHAVDGDGVGAERYKRDANAYLGMDIDIADVYEWGWSEVNRVNAEIESVCKQINADATLPEIIEQLNNDHERWIHGEDHLVDWLHALLQNAIVRFDGSMFDIPTPLKQLEVKIAPPGGPANQYYVPPSEDLSRPGVYWYPTNGKTRFPMWGEISTAYHEGVPGHHLQCGWVKLQHDQLTRYQRNLFITGHGEGWALYAERLADEIGLLERPEYRLDMLMNNLFRAARVVVDLGMHMQLTIPHDARFHPGETWNPQLGHDFMLSHSNMSEEIITSEIVRYLGIPGQAISYKLGERIWFEARDNARRQRGADFDLKQWHGEMLSLGAMGLDQLMQLTSSPA